MNPHILEFALRKQRLQIRAEQQRAELMGQLERAESVLELIDRTRDRVHGLRVHAPMLSAAALLFVVVKPRQAFRIARRAWVGWLLYRRLGRGLAPILAALKRFGA